ncbi:MAG: cyclic nucleotide-binding domain-containing protein [Verrucomicrobiota bacterium]|nr:cyclic nucleotide-binding domain-containing protein [Verrucomicrobiota bacterium]
MNILSEEQAVSRGLALPPGGLLTDVPPEFIEELQTNGTFVEYNQQVIAAAGAPVDYILCVIAGQASLSRLDDNYTKAHLGAIGVGQWFGEMSLFTNIPAREELFARGDVVVWTIAPDTLRDLFFRRLESVQLLYNIATVLSQKLSVTSGASVSTSVPA